MDRSDHRLHRHSSADGIRNDLLRRSMLNKVNTLPGIMLGRVFFLLTTEISLVVPDRQHGQVVTLLCRPHKLADGIVHVSDEVGGLGDMLGDG